MDRSAPREVRVLPHHAWAIPQSPLSWHGAHTRRWLAVALATGGFFLAVLGVAYTLTGVPDPGLSISGDRVTDVLPGGPAWGNEFRDGDVVTALQPSDAAGGWSVTAEGHGFLHTTTTLAETLRLRALVSLALLGLGLVVLALVALRPLPAAAPMLACLGLGLSLQGVVASTGPVESTLAGLGVLGALAMWGLAASGRTRTGAATALVASLAAIAWLAGRFLVPAMFELADGGRVAAWASLSAALFIVPERAGLAGLLRRAGPRGLVDGASIALATALAVVLVLLLHVPLPIVLGALLLAIVLYPRWRRRLVDSVDRLVVAEARTQAVMAGREAERARLARDIHDEPLQDLAAIIRRLDRIPPASREAASLREVADHLRRLAADLHPPVLEDLGLAPALRSLRSAATGETEDRLEVEVALVDLTGREQAQRPPRDVETACYRIVQEALANARAHAQASLVEIVGRIEPRHIELVVRDDGCGIDQDRVLRAEAAGHFGLLDMRERAASIAARLRVERVESGGTEVSLAWDSP
jgi:signal transduction histidine kinase